MKKQFIDQIKKDKKIIKKNIFENLFRLIVDYQLTSMFGKKGFMLMEHIDFVFEIVISKTEQPYIEYIRENMLKSEEPEKYLKAVQLLLTNIERYFWFWIEDHSTNNLIKDLMELSELFNAFRDRLTSEKFSHDLKMKPADAIESDTIVEENRFFLYKKTREIKDYFESVLESTTDAVISTDVDGKIVLFNTGAAQMFQYDPDEVFHKNISFLYVDPDEAELLKNAIIEGKGKTHAFETTLQDKEGNVFPVLISASLLKSKNGVSKGIVRYIKNISKIKELEIELRNLSEFKSRHLHNISHEIKTPISTIIGFIDIISKYYDHNLDVNVERYMQKIRATSQVLLELLDTLLDLSRIESGKLKLNYTEFKPTELLDEIKLIFLPLLSEKGIDFSTNNKVKFDNMMADRPRMRQIMFNLVSNAVKYTPESGKVTITLSSDDKNLIILVQDNGKGIEEEDLKHIFDEFVQMDSKAGTGYGLGLALIKHLAELHNGSIKVESKKDIGSKFKVVIPQKPWHLNPN